MRYFSFLFIFGCLIWWGLSFQEFQTTPVQNLDLSSMDYTSELSENNYLWTESEVREYEKFEDESNRLAMQEYTRLLQKKRLGRAPVPRGKEDERLAQIITQTSPLTEEEQKALADGVTVEKIDGESCQDVNGASRNYLENAFLKIPDEYLKPRVSKTFAAEHATQKYYDQQKVTPRCVTFVMKKFFEPAMKEPKKLFAYCHESKGSPELDHEAQNLMREEIARLEAELQSGEKLSEDDKLELSKKIKQLSGDVEWRHKYYRTPCVTENYVNMTYNVFQDVTECLNISQKELLPKFFNESGLHINAYGGGRDAGMGQLTGAAIRVTKSVLSKYVEEMQKSGKASCERILNVRSAWEDIDPSPYQRCNLMGTPENPLRNLLYSGIFYKENVKMISGIYYSAGQDRVRLNTGDVADLTYTNKDQLGGLLGRNNAQEKLQKLGLKNVNMHDVKNILVALAYNSGPETTVNKFVDYLDERLEAKNKTKKTDKIKFNLTPDDFNFALHDVKPVRQQIMTTFIKSILIENEKSETPDEVLLKELHALREKERRRIIDLPTQYNNAYTLSLPQFLTMRTNAGPQPPDSKKRSYELYGYPGYLSALSLKNEILNKYFPNNECTNPNYLKLGK